MTPNQNTEIIILPDRTALARQAATRFVSLARAAIESHGRFAVALSGGSTPRAVYTLLAAPEFASQIDWARVYLFWGDERAVPPDHPDSNYKMAHDALVARVRVPAQNVHRIPTEKNPDDAAREYENELREFFNLDVSWRAPQGRSNLHPHPAPPPSATGEGVIPSFDLFLLGLGADGHTASLFPHTRVLHETTRWVAAEYVEKLKAHRITLTAPIINAAANILFLVAGADKATAVRAVLRGAYRPDDLPAQLIQPTNGRVVWLLDQVASEKCKSKAKSMVCYFV